MAPKDGTAPTRGAGRRPAGFYIGRRAKASPAIQLLRIRRARLPVRKEAER